YDRFHHGYDKIYRITATLPEMNVHAAVTSAPLAQAFSNELPEIDDAVRISSPNRDLIQVGDIKFEEDGIIYADSNFFRFFTFPFVTGDRERALENPEGIVITEEMAMKYFGSIDVLGRTIRKNDNDDFAVTGVIADVPHNSHLQFSFVQPMRFLARTNNDLKNNVWDNFNYFTYVKVNDKALESPGVIGVIEEKMQSIYKAHEPVLKVG